MADVLADPNAPAAPPAPDPLGPQGEAPKANPYDDHPKILADVKQKMQDWGRGRDGIMRGAWRNILFFRGHQWIRWDRATNRWRPAKLRANTPTPVTNRYACLDGDTIIPCLDGTKPTIRELADRQAMPWLYGFDRDNVSVVPVLAERVWKTGERECVRVEFEEKTSVVCTPDHKFLTWVRGYVEAKDLRPGESIVPFSQWVSHHGYTYVMQPADAHWKAVHSLVARDVYGPKQHGTQIHHENEVKTDNRPENLKIMAHSEHASLSATRAHAKGQIRYGPRPAMAAVWKIPGNREKWSKGIRAARQRPESRAKAGETMKRLWADPAYRAKQSESRKKAWTPERRAALSEQAKQEGMVKRITRPNHRVRAVVPVGVREVYDICTPRTNNFAIGAGVFVHNSSMGAYISVLSRIEPRLNFRPGTDDPEDRATADVASRAIQVIEDEVGIRAERQRLATWSGLTTGAWLELGYDPDPIHGTTFLQHEQCGSCGVTAPPSETPICPGCGGGVMQPAIDPMTGEPVGEDMPIGKMYTDAVPCFEMFFDPAIQDWSKQKRFARKRSRALDDAKAAWPALKDRISPDSMGTHTGENYMDALPTLAGAFEDNQTARLGQQPLGTSLLPSRVSETWYWSLPDETYPEGLLAIVVGSSLIAHAGPLPYRSKNDDKPFLPFVYFPQQYVPGSAWTKTVADDLASKASQRNRVESLIEAILMRTANPVWLVPAGSNVTNATGDPGQWITYNALGPSPAKPERIPGQGVPAGLMVFLERSDKDFEELSGMFEVMKGARPEGVSAGIALQILQERAQSRFGPMFISWENAWAEWARQALEIFRQFATEARLLKIQGRDGAWQVQKFRGADLRGRVDVIPEAGSSMPRSSLLDRAEIEQLIALGVINQQDPEVRYKILEIYGRSNLTPGMAADTKNAMREDEAFAELAQNPVLQDPRVEQTIMAAMQQIDTTTGQPVSFDQIVAVGAQAGLPIPRVRPAVDDHGVHSREHGNWLKSESSQTYPPLIQRLAEAHKAEHDRLAAVQMQATIQSRQGTHPTSGFLNNPGGQTSPMNSGSSGQRMQGEHEEMGQQMGGMS